MFYLALKFSDCFIGAGGGLGLLAFEETLTNLYSKFPGFVFSQKVIKKSQPS